MLFNVSQLMREPSGSARTFEVDEAWTLTEGAHVSRVRGTVSMLRTDKGIWVSATLDSRAPCTCNRCLKEYQQPVHMAIEEEYFPVVDVDTGAAGDRSGDGDEVFYVDHNHILDLREAARQYAAIGIPMKPVCREDCAGICPNCGANLNESPCTCDKTTRDGRWGPLAELVATSDKNN